MVRWVAAARSRAGAGAAATDGRHPPGSECCIQRSNPLLHAIHSSPATPAGIKTADQIRLMDACCYTGRVRPDEEADVPFREDRWVGLSPCHGNDDQILPTSQCFGWV